MNPAVGKTAIVGIGGIIVSINAAMNTPANRYSESKSEIH